MTGLAEKYVKFFDKMLNKKELFWKLINFSQTSSNGQKIFRYFWVGKKPMLNGVYMIVNDFWTIPMSQIQILSGMVSGTSCQKQKIILELCSI